MTTWQEWRAVRGEIASLGPGNHLTNFQGKNRASVTPACWLTIASLAAYGVASPSQIVEVKNQRGDATTID